MVLLPGRPTVPVPVADLGIPEPFPLRHVQRPRTDSQAFQEEFDYLLGRTKVPPP